MSVGAPWDPAFIKNPDAMVRLERVRQLMEGGGWFDQTLARIGTLDHLQLHWTRPLDVLLVPVAWLAQHFMDATDALVTSGILLSFPFGLLGLVLASQLPRLVDEHHPFVLGAGAFFIAQSPHWFLVFAAPMSPDHHGLMVLLYIAALISGYRSLASANPAWAWTFGLVQALAVWISPESLLVVACLNIGAGILWGANMREGVAHTMRRSNLAFTVGLSLALLLEYGPNLPRFELDRLSFFSIAIGLVLLGLWHAFIVFGRGLTTPLKRIGMACGGAILAAILLVTLNPNALHGPMGEADPWFITTWTGYFSDGFWMTPYGVTVTYIAALVCAWFWTHQSQSHGQTPWVVVYLLPTFVIFATLSLIHSPRWVPYAELIAMPFIVTMFIRAGRAVLQRPPGWTRYVLISSLTLGFMLLANIYIFRVSLAADKLEDQISSSAKQCDLYGLIDRLNTLADQKGPQRVLGYANITPAIALHTPHRIQAVPIHPDARAVRHSVDVFITELDAPKNIDADVIVMCSVGHERDAFGAQPGSLYSRLMRGETIPGLSEFMPVAVSGESPAYKIYAVAPDRSTPNTQH